MGHQESPTEEKVVGVRIRRKLPVVPLALMVAVGGIALWAQPAVAATVVRTMVHIDEHRISDVADCGFRIREHALGNFMQRDYYDNSGFLYKTAFTVGPGP